jgi:hypothetical protein
MYATTLLLYLHKNSHIIMHVFRRTHFYIPGLSMSYSSTNVCKINGFIDIIVGSIFITSFRLHIQCRLN